jgi:hypothetical protein
MLDLNRTTFSAVSMSFPLSATNFFKMLDIFQRHHDIYFTIIYLMGMLLFLHKNLVSLPC